MKKVLAISFAAILPFASMAEEGKSAINYNYVEAGLGSVSIESADEDFDGNYVSGSLAINDNFNFLYSSVSGDANIVNTNIDIKVVGFGIGYHAPISASTDLQVSYADSKITAAADGESVTFDGSTMSLGVATMLSDNTQVSVSFDRAKIEGESESGNTIAIVHQVTDTIALTASRTDVGEVEGVDVDVTSYGVRYNF